MSLAFNLGFTVNGQEIDLSCSECIYNANWFQQNVFQKSFTSISVIIYNLQARRLQDYTEPRFEKNCKIHRSIPPRVDIVKMSAM